MSATCRRLQRSLGIRHAAATVAVVLAGTLFAAVPTAPAGAAEDGPRWYLADRHGAPSADRVVAAGKPTDEVLGGDWNGDGTTTPGFKRGNVYVLDGDGDGRADAWFRYGHPDARPLVGDWDGDGVDTVGVHHGGRFYLRNDHAGGYAEVEQAYGLPDDLPVAGDWNGDGTDTPGVVRGNTWLLTDRHRTSTADLTYEYGSPADAPLTGDWDGDGTDTPGAVRGLERRVSLGPFEASCYVLRGVTASGHHAGSDVVAVDPRVIPLGTRLWIDGFGYRYARDTGSAIKGRRIDIWMSSYHQCREWGRRPVHVSRVER